MNSVNTVLGEIPASELGNTLMHEHIMIINNAMLNAFNDIFDRKRFITEVVSDLKYIKSRGIKTIVDSSAINLGRDINILKEVSEKSGVQIIPSTGFFCYEEPWMQWRPESYILGLLMNELENGIQNTNIKPGIIKIATDTVGMTPVNYKMLKITAAFCRETGIPITTHSVPSLQTGLMQAEIFEAENVDLSKVLIGHSGDSEDIDYLKKLLDKGCYIGMDRFGLSGILSTEKRIKVITKLFELGYTDQMVLSNDYCAFVDWFSEEDKKALFPEWSFKTVSDQVIPELLKQGMPQQVIDKLIKKNPIRFFSQK